MTSSSETAVSLDLHGQEYIIIARILSQQKLELLVEEEQGNARWGAILEGQYIEEITRKTGNYKRFPIFVRMLFSALTQQSESVFIDLLTYADLEHYKTKKEGLDIENTMLSRPTQKESPSAKRYLILTYAVEFDRIHYPLPLTYIQQPSVDMLQRTINRLRTGHAVPETSCLQEIGHSPQYGNNMEENSNPNRIQKLQQVNQQISSEYDRVRQESAVKIAALEKKLDEAVSGPPSVRVRKDAMMGTLKENNTSLQQKIRVVERDFKKEREEREKEAVYFKRYQRDADMEMDALKNKVQVLTEKNQELMKVVARIRAAPPTEKQQSSSSPVKVHHEREMRTVTRPKRSPSRKATPRFDPTAYVKEKQKQRKLRTRSQSPRVVARRRSDNTGTRPDYLSDSSGYASTDSERQVTRRSTRRVAAPRPEYFSDSERSSRSRGGGGRRVVSSSHQRSLDSRLSSPKNPRFPSPGRSSGFSRSPSPRPRRRQPTGTQPPRHVPPPLVLRRPSAPKSPVLSPPPTPCMKTTSDVVMDGSTPFHDINSRLDALQSFLRQAKGTGGDTMEL